MTSPNNGLKPKNGSVMMIIAVSVCIWIFLMEPVLILFGAFIFFIGVVCFHAGAKAKKEVMEEKSEKKPEKGFRTYKEQQEVNVKEKMRKDFNPDDPKEQEFRESLKKQVEENRKQAEQEEKDDIFNEKHPVQDTP